MLQLPSWVPLFVGTLVVVFGAYRMRLAFRSKNDDERARARGGMYGFGRRTHFLFGLVYFIMGAMLIASALGLQILPSSR